MYADKFLTFAGPGIPVAATTRALPLGQLDLSQSVPPALLGPKAPKETDGMGPYNVSRLWIYCGAIEDVPAGFTLRLEHADEMAGPFTAVQTFGPTTMAAAPGETVLKFAMPFQVKNWIRFVLSSAIPTNIIMTPDVEKLINGLRLI